MINNLNTLTSADRFEALNKEARHIAKHADIGFTYWIDGQIHNSRFNISILRGIDHILGNTINRLCYILFPDKPVKRREPMFMNLNIF